jgi:hypothetical protein
MPMQLEEFEYLVTRSLELGVPTDICSELFELPLDTCTELQSRVRVRKFGTDDMSEYVEGIQWRALEVADRLLRQGNTDQAIKIVTAVFGRQIQAAGRRPSSELEKARAQILGRLGDMRDAAPVSVGAGRFVVGNVATERKANRDEEDEDV